MIDAVVAGHICLDIIPDLSDHLKGQFDAAFQPGKLVHAGPANLFPGGAVANTGLALDRLGLRTQLIGKTGNDALGRVLRQLVTDHGEDLGKGIIAAATSSTSYTIVISSPESDRRFLHHPGANDDFISEDITEEMVRDARLFHFGYPPLMRNMYLEDGQQLAELLQRVKKLGLTTSLDMAYPDPLSEAGKADWSSILHNTLPYVDLFVPSFDEIVFMLYHKMDLPLSAETLTRVSGELMGMGAKMVLLKLGDRGLYLRTGSAERMSRLGRAMPKESERWCDFEAWLPCFKVNVAGTTGSGDVTIAGFLASLLKSLAPEDALQTALAVGACNVEAIDALSGLRSWEETQQRIATGWEKRAEKEQFIRPGN
jgi:sugar/nucleoside kinase (ribokinase family)